MRLASILALIGHVLGGCTLVNAPDRDRLDAASFDGGMDASDPEDAGDADSDEPDPPDTGVDADTRPPENCANGVDDDDDGLVDCEDFDCAAETAACCREAAPAPDLAITDWPSNLDDDWDATLRVDSSAIFPEVRGGETTPSVLRFSRSRAPHALVLESCVPLGQGAQLRARFGPRGDAESFAALVLTPVDEQRVPRRLPAELAVTFYGSGRVEVSQDETVLARSDELSPLTETLFYDLDVDRPVDVDDAGRGVLRANVTIRDTMNDERFAWSAPLIALENLFFDRASCQDSAGLRLAFEGAAGATDVVEVGAVTVGQLACTNPGQFLRRLDDPLSAGDVPGVVTASLDFDATERDPRWADEAMLSASLLGISGTPNPVWHVAAEATNDQPELVTTARVGWAIGYAFESTWNVDTWSDASEQPVVGQAPPSCLDGSCTTAPPAARDPHLFATGSQVNLVYAAERNTSERFEIHFASALSTSPATGASLLTLEDEPGCDSLRDPAIVPRDTGPEDTGLPSYWLFFTCERANAPPTIRARALEVDLMGLGPTTEPSVEVLSAADLGSFARDGVRSPEPVLDGDVYRLWFLGLDQVTGASVGVAVGQPKTPGALPTLVPYPANPILQSGDPAFDDCPGCTLEGIAVARHPDRVDQLRFLVTRRVPLAGGGRRYDLMPLDQTWRATRMDSRSESR